MKLEDLHPYVALILASAPRRLRMKELGTGLRTATEALIQSGPDKSVVLHSSGPHRRRELYVSFVVYSQKIQPRWTSDPALMDTVNQLVVICRMKRQLAIVVTDPQLAARIGRCLGQGGEPGFCKLEPIEPSILNAAFAKGRARTLWLSGIHTRSTVKPDSKILAGINLRDALDPLDDQSYYFTAARCLVAFASGSPVPVGVTPRRSRIWSGPSRVWAEFEGTVRQLLNRLAAVKHGEEAPLPWLATRASGTHGVDGACDVSLVAPELSSEEPIDATLREQLERWSYGAAFDVTQAAGASFQVAIRLHGSWVGDLQVAVDARDADQIRTTVSSLPGARDEEALEEVASLCQHRRWLQVRYESGHTLADGQLYRARFRDVRFEGWRWPELHGIDRTVEKPAKPATPTKLEPTLIGKTGSLFCWVWNQWPEERRRRGWLACDDGSREIADFIHLDDAIDPPRLSLIHVKAAHSDTVGRGLSVSAYEVVTAQAVKNLRFLESALVNRGLTDVVRRSTSDIVWHNGARQRNRDHFLAALDGLPRQYERYVVIIQPSVTRTALEAARGSSASSRGTKLPPQVGLLRQLETLLVGVEANCHALGAKLLVFGDGAADGAGRRHRLGRRPSGKVAAR